jgi:uncharacterized protein YjdB
MKNFYQFLPILILGVLLNSAAVKAQSFTTVFTDTFNFEGVGPCGDPAITAGPSGSFPLGFGWGQIGGWDLATGTTIPFNPDYLACYVQGGGGANGWGQWTYELVDVGGGGAEWYLPPFRAKLNSNIGLVTWAFNMQTQTPQSGNFAFSDNEVLVVLGSTNFRVFTSGVDIPTATGYAVTFKPTPPYGVRLIKYTGGISGTAAATNTPTVVISSTASVGVTNPTDYLSVRVTYDPSSDRWSLYVRDDGPTAFANPWTGVTTLVGSAIDNTYTGMTMTNFGFYAHYNVPGTSSTVRYAYFDNYRVTVDCTLPINGPDTVCIGQDATQTNGNAGGVWTSTNTAVGTIDATTGVLTGITAGTTTISYDRGPGCVISRIVTVRALPTISGTLEVCEGLTTALAGAAPTGGTWLSSTGTVGTISTSGVLTGIAAGNTTITYTNTATGCYATAVATVNALPASITGSSSVCINSTITLSSTTAGGTWSIGPGSEATIDASGVVTGAVAGTTTATYTLATGCLRTYALTVNALPAAIGGTLATCVGSTAALTNATAGGTWSSSTASVGTIDATTGVLAGIAAGTTTTTFTITATGCYVTAIATVNPLPANITGTLTVCENSVTTLSTTSTGGTWSSSDISVATVGTGGNVTGVLAGTVIISYTFPTGCAAIANVTVNPAPAAITGPSTVCIGSTITLNHTTPGGTWTSNNSNTTAGASTGYITGVTAGTSIIRYSVDPTCWVSQIVTVNALPTNITGTMTVCVNATTTLTSGIGGTWSSSTMAVGTVNGTGVVTGLSSGTTRITYTASTGCFRTAIVTVNPLPNTITGPGTVCEGSNITLSSTSSGGTWSSSTTNTSIVSLGTSAAITGVSAGTSVITYRFTTTGCQQTRTITVNPLPGAITGPASVCVGATATLSTTSTGGAWSSSTGSIGTINALGEITGIATGTTTITYTLPTTCFVTRVETVNTTPPALITPIGPTTFCPGSFVVLTANTGVSLSYQWQVGGSPISGATSSTYTATAGGSYEVIVSNGIGCSATATPVVVTVAAVTASITTATGTSVGCESGLLLTATSGAGLSYQWQSAGVAIPGETNSTYTATVSGDYSVIVSNTSGCSDMAGVSLTLHPSPSNVVTLSGPLTFCSGSSVTMTASAGTGYAYQWYNASGAIPGATSISYTAAVSGTYSVSVTNSFSCSDNSAAIVVVVNPLPSAAITHASYTIFCAGTGSVILNASAAAGLTYQWLLGGTTIAGATNSSYTATTSGGYRVEVTDPATGCVAITGADTVVTAVSSASVTPLTPAEYCWGGSAWLASSVLSATGAVTYQWYRNDATGTPTVVPGAVGNTYNATMSGTYSVRMTIAGTPTCVVTSSMIDVVERPLPNPVVSYNATTHVFSSQTYFVTYQWHKNYVPIAGATAYTTVATGNGSYRVQVTDTNGCQSFAEAYVLTNFGGGGGSGGSGTGVATISKDDVQIFPNPAADIVHISAPQAVRAVVRAIDGRSLISVENATDVNIANLADGIYTIMIYTGDNQLLKAEKLIKATR